MAFNPFARHAPAEAGAAARRHHRHRTEVRCFAAPWDDPQAVGDGAVAEPAVEPEGTLRAACEPAVNAAGTRAIRRALSHVEDNLYRYRRFGKPTDVTGDGETYESVIKKLEQEQRQLEAALAGVKDEGGAR